MQLIDDLRGALDAVKADRLNVNVYRDGASEVKNTALATVDPSTTRVTVVTPTSGKKIRVVSVTMHNRNVTDVLYQLWFGAGATLDTDVSKAIHQAYLTGDLIPNDYADWPDGGGPVGAVDEVVSMRTSGNITTSAGLVLHYREE